VDFPVRRIRIELDSMNVPGWNEIDAVGLVDDAGRTHWAARVTASSTWTSSASGVSISPQPGMTLKAARFTFRGVPAVAPAAAASVPQSPDTLWPAGWGGPTGASAQFEDGTVKTERVAADARGWPMLALWSPRPLAAGATPAAVGPSYSPQLPWRPLWGGFLVNSALYAA
jgi:hypothetical protein